MHYLTLDTNSVDQSLRHTNPSETSIHAFDFFRIVKEQPINRSSNNDNSLGSAGIRLLNVSESKMVEDDGIEPTTPCLQSRCSPS